MYILLIGVVIHVYITVVNAMSCDNDWLEYQGICLKHYSKTIHWAGAQGTCVKLRKAQLAIVDSPELNMFVHDNLTRGSNVWIGLSIPDISRPNWKWSDGNDTSSYNDWNTADLAWSCAVMKYDSSERYWYTRPCTHVNYYICEKEMFANRCVDWLQFDSHCYLIIEGPQETNMAAARYCWQHDAYLVSINSQQEADLIYSKIMTNKDYWIGLSPLKWANDEPYQWNNWDDSGPSVTERCVYMNATSGKWLYGNCGSPVLDKEHHSYICQKDAGIDFPTANVAEEVASPTNTVLGEPYTAESDALNISNTKSSTDDSKPLLLTAVVPSVCGGLVVIIVIIVVVIVIRRKIRITASQDAKSNAAAIYYNDIQKTRDNEMVKATDTNQRKLDGTNRYVSTEDSHTSSAGDMERNTYEQLSVGPYVNSGQIQAGTYASLQ